VTPEDRIAREEGRAIDRLFDAGKVAEARKLIKRRLREVGESDFDAHWLWCRLSWSYYFFEQDGRKALQHAMTAHALAPRCPMVAECRVYALIRLGKHRDAIQIARELIRRGATALSRGDCADTPAAARATIADAHYDISWCYQQLANLPAARRHLQAHFSLRGPGIRTNTPLASARELEKELREVAMPKKKTATRSAR